MALDAAECQLHSSLLIGCVLQDMGSKMIFNSILKLSRFPTGCKIAWLLQIGFRVVDKMIAPFFVIKPLVIAGFGQTLS